jgi:hypothetical protein
MRRKAMLVLALTLLAALGLVAAGCGGSSSKSAATTEAATTEAATTEAATTEATTTEAATTEATTTEATTTTNLSGFSSGKCRELENLSKKFSAAFTGSDQNLKKEAELVQDFAKKVPSEIRADFQLIADYFSKIADVAGNLKPGQTPDPQTLAKLQKVATEVDQAKLQEASQRITAWGQKNCHA